MAKIIRYDFLSEVNTGTIEEPNIQQTHIPMEIKCETKAVYDANYPIAEKEAIPGTIEVSGEFDPIPEPTPSVEERVEHLEESSTEMQQAIDVLLLGAF